MRTSTKAYQNREGVFAKADSQGNVNEWWIDEFITKNAPWEFRAEVPKINYKTEP